MTAKAEPQQFPHPSVSDEAAAWFARQRAGPLSERETSEFAQWLKADHTHAIVWAEYERVWNRVDAARDDPRILILRESARGRDGRRQALRYSSRIGAGIAASAVLGTLVWWNTQHASVTAPPVVVSTHTTHAKTTPLVRDASTAVGERVGVVLPDGSKVTLNTASAFHADYTGSDRRVTLVRGEAFFEVAKDPTRPFIVSADSRQVIAVGTAFDVRLQAKQVKVTLVEGKVRVVRAASSMSGTAHQERNTPVTLEAGSALIAREDGIDRVEHLDTARATSWLSGKLVFDGERLADVIAEMNRYSRERLEIADPTLESRKVSGVFEPNGGPAFAKALEAYGIARIARMSPTTITLESPR